MDKPPRFKVWLRAAGLFRGFWLVSLIPVSAGAALAWHEGRGFTALTFIMTVLGVWALHIAANLLNDYYDHRNGTDDINQVRTPFSGGTRVIQEGLLAPGSLARAAKGCQGVGVVLLCALAVVTARPLVILYASIGLLGGLFYSGAGLWLAARGLGELTLGAIFGPTLVSFGFYVQAGTVSPAAWLAGAIFGIGAAAVLTINEFPDVVADAAVGKRNLVVRVGRRRGFAVYSAMLLLMPAGVAFGAAEGLFPATCLIALISGCLMALIIGRGHRALDQLPRQIAASRNTIVIHVATWALFMLGIGLDHWL